MIGFAASGIILAINGGHEFTKFSIGLFILLLVIAAPLFAHLGNMPLQMWDEARQAISALEMGSNHHWLVSYYDGKPDMADTKPPLLIWLQLLSIKLLGANELAVRFPSALAAAFTCFIIYWFCGYKYKQPWLGAYQRMCAGNIAGICNDTRHAHGRV